MQSKLKVLLYTTLFPNSVQPVLGHFTIERVRSLRSVADFTVVSPVPYFPRVHLNERWFKFAITPRKEHFGGFEINHPRYLVFPKAGMVTHGFSMFAGSLLGLWKRLRASNYDLIDAQFLYPEGLAAVMLGAVLKKPVVVSALGSDVNIFPQLTMIRPLIKQVLKRADAVIALSAPLRDIIVDLGCPPDKVRVIRNGIDPAKFRPLPMGEARETLGLPAGAEIVLSVGNLTENKGHHLLIDAVARLRSLHPELMLLIIGEGPCQDRLEKQIRDLALHDRVKLVGTRPNQELYTWYSAADVFCLASEREGCPNVVLEAIACGCPVVATRAGGIGEIITSQSLGILVDRTTEAFMGAINTALGNRWDRADIAAQGHSHALDKIAASILDVYSGIIARHKVHKQDLRLGYHG